MIDDTKRWENAVKKLIELTENRQLHWTAMREGQSLHGIDVIGSVYVTDAEGKEIAVYKKKRNPSSRESRLYRSSRPYSVIIQFTDGDWIWPVPMEDRVTLLEAIQEQVANAEEFLNRFLADEPVS